MIVGQISMSRQQVNYKLLAQFDTEALREFDQQLKQRLREEAQRRREPDSKPRHKRRRR